MLSIIITDDPRDYLDIGYNGTKFKINQATKGSFPDVKLERTIVLNDKEATQLVYFILHNLLGTW